MAKGGRLSIEACLLMRGRTYIPSFCISFHYLLVLWEETAEAFGTRLKAATDYVNENYDLVSLQKELPDRLVMLSEQEGGRIGK